MPKTPEEIIGRGAVMDLAEYGYTIVETQQITNALQRATVGEFELFWDAFPNKVGKADARKKFIIARRKVSMNVLMAGLMRYRAKSDDRAWCNPSTFLHQERWDDEAPQPIAASKGLAGVRARLTQEIANDGYSSRDQGNGLDHAGGVPQLEFFGH